MNDIIDPVLVTATYAGNLHTSARALNDLKLARYVLGMDYSGGYTIVVLRMERKEAESNLVIRSM